MTIAALAVGAEKGFIYVRGEYSLAAERMACAIRTARAARIPRQQILDSPLQFDVEVRRGAGAYICGEETALFNSIEGYRGEPRNKPPSPRNRASSTSPPWSITSRHSSIFPTLFSKAVPHSPASARSTHRDATILRVRTHRPTGRVRGADRLDAARSYQSRWRSGRHR